MRQRILEDEIQQIIGNLHRGGQQAARVEATAQVLFDQVAASWQLDAELYRPILCWAAMLHETGLAINYSAIQRHSAYILENSDLPGFDETGDGALYKFGYGLSLKSARQWGLFISTSRGKTSIGIEEPALFSEPGLFLVRPDGTLYYGAVQTMPFARPSFKDLLMAIDFAIEKDYPARGEYTGAV